MQPTEPKRTAVVTGAARGIGRAIALELAGGGFDVIVHTRASRAEGEAVVREIESIGRRGWLVLADLQESVQRDGLVEECWKLDESISVWVNNAGADVLTGPAADWSVEEKLDHLWAVDVKGTFFLSRAAGARLAESPLKGLIVNIGWDQANHGMAGDSGEVFAMTKGAIMAFTRSLAQTLGPSVRVNCVAPGWIKTSWGMQASEYWQARATRESLLSRWGTPEDVGRAVAFLASPAAEFINGQTLEINGGFRLGATD